MDSMREGGSVNMPPILDGKNYSYWKVRITSYIRSVDEKSWSAVLHGWNEPKDADGKQKLREKWDANDMQASSMNQKALNAILSSVDMENFNLISTCSSAKEAWETLQNAYEGNSRVKAQRLQQLMSKFEMLKMEEDETVSEFHTKLKYISNECFSLGEKMSQEKLCAKVLRSLPRRFDFKVAAIEEARDLTAMTIDELSGSLRTFEMGMREKAVPRKKSIAFAASNGSIDNGMQGLTSEEDLLESYALLTRNFNKAMKQFRGRRNNEENSTITGEKLPIICNECGGKGHIKSEEEEEEEEEEEDIGTTNPPNIAYTAKVDEDDHNESEDLENLFGENAEAESEANVELLITNAYKDMHDKCILVIEMNMSLTDELKMVKDERNKLILKNNQLEDHLTPMNEKETCQNGDINHLVKLMKMMTT